jgi:hypothetical protein
VLSKSCKPQAASNSFSRVVIADGVVPTAPAPAAAVTLQWRATAFNASSCLKVSPCIRNNLIHAAIFSNFLWLGMA